MGTLFVLALAFHLSLVISQGGGFWNRYTFDSVATHGRRGWDFYALYQAGHNALHGCSVYQQDPNLVDIVVPWHTPYRYLPIVAYLLGFPFQALDPHSALIVWMTLVDLLVVGCALYSWRRYGGWSGLIAAVMWLLFTPYYLEFYLGQFNVVQAVLIFGMLIALESGPGWVALGRWWLASLLWKHNTLLFAPLMVRLRRWRALVIAALSVLLSALYLYLHPVAWQAFRNNLFSGPPAHRLGDLGGRQLIFSLGSCSFPNLSSGVHWLSQLVWVGLIVLTSVLATFLAGTDCGVELLCLWTAAFFLIYHDVWEHHYVLLVPVYVVIYQRTRHWLLLLLYTLTALWTPYILIDPQGLAAYHIPMRWTALQPSIIDVAYHASKALPTLVLWGYLVRRLLSRRFSRGRTCQTC